MIEHEEKCVGWSDTVKCVGHYQGRPACLGFEPYCCSCEHNRNRDAYFEIKNGEILGSSAALYGLVGAINNALTFNTSEFRWKDASGKESVWIIRKDDCVE